MNVGYSIAYWSSTKCLHVNVNNESFFENIVIAIPDFMLDALLS